MTYSKHGNTPPVLTDSATKGSAGGAFVLPAPTAFVTVWEIDPGDELILVTKGNYTIDWGDGCTEQIKLNDNQLLGFNHVKHVYDSCGSNKHNTPGGLAQGVPPRAPVMSHSAKTGKTRTITISAPDNGVGGITRFSIYSWSGALRLIDVKQWGNAQWESTCSMFFNAQNMQMSATDAPDLSCADNTDKMFEHCRYMNSPIEHWDTSAIISMEAMFRHATSFNQSISQLDLKKVEQVEDMLKGATAFEQNLEQLKLNANTDDMFGYKKSLNNYIEQRKEKYRAMDDKQELNNVFIEQQPQTL